MLHILSLKSLLKNERYMPLSKNLITVFLTVTLYVQPALASHDATSSSYAQEAGRNLFEKLHAVEVKSIAKFLDQKNINHLLASSRRCNADVRGENLTTFTQGRKDTLILDTPEKLNEFLINRTDHLYASNTKLEVSIHDEEELRRLFSHQKLHRSLTELTLRYITPFEGMTGIEENSVKIDIVALLAPFQKMKSVQVTGSKNDEPTEAFRLMNNNQEKAFKDCILSEPKALIIWNGNGDTLATWAAFNGKWDAVKILAEHFPESMKEKNSDGDTPAHFAAQSGVSYILKIISDHAPESMKEKDSRGHTPAEVASTFSSIIMFNL
jgi:hypothetical protein